MKKKSISLLLSGLLAVTLLTGCGGAGSETAATSATETTAGQADSQEQSQGSDSSGSQDENGEKSQAENEKGSDADAKESASQADSPESTGDAEGKEAAGSDTDGEDITLRVGSLKGPTSMGLVFLMEMAEGGKTEQTYDFTMVTSADELLPKVIGGDLDIALVPANVASVLYGRTEGQVAVIDINTLGVLYGVTADNSIQSIGDLAGKTVYMTGKGTTPDYVFQYLLEANGIQDQVALEFKSEPGEVAALLANQPEAIGILPQPFVTVACAQNEALGIALDLTAEWDKAQEEKGSQMVTGVTLVRKEFLEKHPDAVSLFLKDHEKSAAYTKEQPDQAAELIVKAGIIEKAPVAKKALPYCNITCITGQEMKAALSGYLQVLFDRDPKSVGGKMPEDDFYFIEP